VLKLDKTVKCLYLQFSFSNRNTVPKWLPWKEEETADQSKERRARKTHGAGMGVCVIEPTESCSIESLPDEVAPAGFYLVDAYAQQRTDPNNPRKRWYMARFIFIRTEELDPNREDELKGLREGVEVGLQELCILALWRVRAWKNPYFKDGEPVEGLHAASVNMEVRKPRFSPNGDPILQWERDAEGNKVGDAPLPLVPAAYLRIVDDTLQLASETGIVYDEAANG
jgi:hypothetical protein